MPNNFRNLLIHGYSTTVQADNDPVEVSQWAEIAQSKQDVLTKTLYFKLENEGMLERASLRSGLRAVRPGAPW